MATLVLLVQRTLLWLSYHWYRLTLRESRKRPVTWVVGTYEIASMISQIARAIPGSFSVALDEDPYYDGLLTYDYVIKGARGTSKRDWSRRICSPILLGRLAHEAKGIIYLGAAGFLENTEDGREYEFAWVKRRGLKVVCYWTGSDIRSLPRMKELETTLGRPNIATYIHLTSPALNTEVSDNARRSLAAACDKWADATFSNTVDHTGYVTMRTEPFLYFLPDDRLGDLSQFDDTSTPVLVHATTSPIIKGTQLVRAAIDKLRAEGRTFEYVELMGVGNEVVVRELRRAHIVLNQFYGFSPAVFGVEGLCAGAVVMMSADETVETDLPAGSNQAWVVTPHHQVYDNLSKLLDDPKSWRGIAERGLEWARQYGTARGAGERLNAVLDSVLEGTYEGAGKP